MRARCVAFQFVDVPVRWYAVDFPSRGAMVPEPVRHGGVLVLAHEPPVREAVPGWARVALPQESGAAALAGEGPALQTVGLGAVLPRGLDRRVFLDRVPMLGVVAQAEQAPRRVFAEPWSIFDQFHPVVAGLERRPRRGQRSRDVALLGVHCRRCARSARPPGVRARRRVIRADRERTRLRARR